MVSPADSSGRSVSKSLSMATRKTCLRLAASASRGRRSPATIVPPIMPRVCNTKRRRVTSADIRCSLPWDGACGCTERCRYEPIPQVSVSALINWLDVLVVAGKMCTTGANGAWPREAVAKCLRGRKYGGRGPMSPWPMPASRLYDVLAEQHAFNKLRLCQQSVSRTPFD